MVGLGDLGDDVRNQLDDAPYDRVEVELAAAVGETLAQQAVRVGDVRDLRVRTELLDVARQVEPVVGGESEQRRVGGGEGAEEAGVRGVEREAQLRDALAPVEEVAPVPADRREEDAAGAHPQHGRHVLDQRRDAPREAGVGVEAQEALDGILVERAVEVVGRLRDEQVQGQYRRADGGRELGTALEAGTRLLVQAVDGDERAARPGQRSLGRDDHVQAVQCALRDLDRARQGALRRDVGSVQAELDPVPGAALQAVGELVSLGRGLEQKASRHRSVQPPRADGRRRVATHRLRPCLPA